MSCPLRRPLLLLLAACAWALLAVGRVAAADRVVLQLPYLHQFQFAGIYAAEQQGYFREAGLEVEIRPTSSQRRSAVQEVAEGRADFGIAQGHQLVAERFAGGDSVVLAAIMQHSPQVLLTRAEDNLNTPHDLVGRRVALDNTSLGSEIRAMLEREGIGFDRITVVPNTWDVDELTSGKADAMSVFVIDAPFLFKRANRAVRIMRPLDYGVDFYGDCLFTSGRKLAADPGTVARMREAVLRGWHYALQHPDELIELIEARYLAENPEGRVVRKFDLDREALRYEAGQVALLIHADLVDLGRINAGRWLRMAEEVRRYQAAGDADLRRVSGMLYQPPPPLAERLRGWGLWMLWAGLAALVVAVLSMLAIRRLRRLVDRRTAELQEAQRRQREIFEHSPAPITQNDYTAVVAELVRLRSAGLQDLAAELARDSGLLARLCGLVRVTDANQLALRTAAVASVAELDRRRMEMLTPEALDTFRDELLAIWAGRAQLRMEKSYVMADGRRRSALISWSALTGPAGPDYSRVQLVFTDLTEVREANEALRESEERYRLLFETTPNPTYIYDAETLRFVMVNDVMTERYGYTREELLQMSVLDIRPAEERERLKLDMQGFRNRARRKGEAYAAGLWRHQRKDGTLIQVEVYTHSLTINGRICVLVLPFDVTAKLAAEAALRESEARHRELFENAVGGVYRSTPDGRFIAVNPALARMLGFATPAEATAWSERHTVSPLYVRPGRREEFMRQFKAQDRMADFESELRRRDGTTIWVSESVRAVRDAGGQILFFEGFLTDITARRRLEVEMTRASKLEAVGILAGGIAHDFNNILTVVLGNVTLAEMDAPAGGELRRMLRDAKQATLRARDLTQQLLTFAKGGDPVRSAVELPELLRESVGFALHGSKARAEFNLAADLWPVNADKGQLGQVVQNLAINSVQAMPQGGIVRVGAMNECLPAGAVGGLPAGEYVRISVSDTGVGIATEHLTKIFDPYFTTKQQGSGLGLATVYSILRKHQGHIEVESQLGVGTTFHFWLPVVRSSAAPAAVETVALPTLSGRVLFMDDEEPILQMAKMFLQRLGMGCEVAADGRAAIEKYRAARADGQPFDAVVMDLTVPGGMGGREALDHLKVIDPGVRVIVSSGYSRDPVLANYQAHGFVGILPKPYGLEQLQKALAEVLPRPPAG